ncbi:putative toxin-antitoxin system toxin component, PIN family [Dyadobacter subterraneus]|uniref:Toxin-antitoxin system toxin component, PIN family n=1 Tax=Dyadobacter subterraneus TaxID=2773304 RepID=A0ABR9W885_9BACT|nr:putative toxin-antitoxin system toxin component, PIN family [Dyadobacter subterraneus]MBE9461692.1 putative toxin-antitoxin system toxin component, PIN family [Dyadobacter subterraneus]
MQNNAVRIILDTNLWISFLITKDLSKLDDIIFSKRAILIFSSELLEEFLEVAQRPKFRRFFPQKDVEEILKTIEEHAEFVFVTSKIEVCRDPKDNFLLGLSIDGSADFLLTGDKDLLDLNPFQNTSIITISEFLQNN